MGSAPETHDAAGSLALPWAWQVASATWKLQDASSPATNIDRTTKTKKVIQSVNASAMLGAEEKLLGQDATQYIVCCTALGNACLE